MRVFGLPGTAKALYQSAQKKPHTNGFVPVMAATDQERRGYDSPAWSLRVCAGCSVGTNHATPIPHCTARAAGSGKNMPIRIHITAMRAPMRSGLILPVISLERTQKPDDPCGAMPCYYPGTLPAVDTSLAVRNPSLCANLHKKGLNSRFVQAITLVCQGRSNNNRNEVRKPENRLDTICERSCSLFQILMIIASMLYAPAWTKMSMS